MYDEKMMLWSAVKLLCYVLLWVVVIALVVTEWGHYVREKQHPLMRRQVRARLLRRGLGGALLVTILVLLGYPPMPVLTPFQQLLKLSACMLLAFLLFLVAVWDYRVVRKEIQREVFGFMQQSAQDLHPLLKERSGEDSSSQS